MKKIILAVALLTATNTYATCYGLTGYQLVNCLNNEQDMRRLKVDQDDDDDHPYEGRVNNVQTCTKTYIPNGLGGFYQTICK